jgi:hypothetical protein
LTADDFRDANFAEVLTKEFSLKFPAMFSDEKGNF